MNVQKKFVPLSNFACISISKSSLTHLTLAYKCDIKCHANVQKENFRTCEGKVEDLGAYKGENTK